MFLLEAREAYNEQPRGAEEGKQEFSMGDFVVLRDTAKREAAYNDSPDKKEVCPAACRCVTLRNFSSSRTHRGIPVPRTERRAQTAYQRLLGNKNIRGLLIIEGIAPER